MNTRDALQPSNLPAVLSIAFSQSRSRFIVGLSEGCRVFRTDNCLTTYQPRIAAPSDALTDGGVGVAAILDDRYLAFVKGGRTPQGSAHSFIFWDATLGKKLSSFDLHEPVIGVKLCTSYAAIILDERTILLQYQRLAEIQQPSPPASPARSEQEDEIGPNKVHSLHTTATNTFGLCVLHSDLLVLPAQSTGQVQLVPLPSGSKRVFRAHNTQLRALALSDDGSVVATASVQGTLIRVFDTKTLDQIAEFRRGVDHAIIYSLAISPGNRWVGCSSDKGTLHVFDLRPNSGAGGGQDTSDTQRSRNRKSVSQVATRSPSSAFSPSSNSVARSSPPVSVQYQGSVQEYYGLLPPPTTASVTSQTAAISALTAFKQSAFAPRALKDVRSVASSPFYMGDEVAHWQGGTAYSWTTGPDGTRRRVKNAVPPLANDPSGRPPKGVLAFAGEKLNDADGALLYVIGGGSDARWERYRLVSSHTGAGLNEWTLVNEGFRNYLTRQFAD